MQDDTDSPVIEDNSLPTMEPATSEQDAEKEPEREADVSVGPSSTPEAAPSAEDSGLMEPFSPEKAERAEKAGEYMAPVAAGDEQTYPDQQEDSTARAAESSGEESGYIRLTFKVEGGQMSITDAHAVAGPLMAQEEIRESEVVYEVTQAQHRLTSGTIPPDPNLVRGAADPDATGELAGHHFSETDSFEFNVRIPKEELSLETLAELGAAVYRVKGGESLGIPESSLQLSDTQASERLRVIAEFKGTSINELSPEIQEQLRSALQ
jgi:hypothetical protein